MVHSKSAPSRRRKPAPAKAAKAAPVQAPAKPARRASGPAPERAERVYAKPEEIKTWLLGTGKPMTQVARLCGLPGGPGPIQAAKSGRPLSAERFARWQATYAQATQ